MTVYLRLLQTALMPVAVSALFAWLMKSQRASRLPVSLQQLLLGLVFGAVSICGTVFGVDIGGAIANVRDAAPLCAGLLFGGPAGILAGLIGGAHRWIFAATAGMYSRTACTVSTMFAGFYAAFLRKVLFSGEDPEAPMGLATGVVMETLHMTVLFLTHLGEDALHAFEIVKICTIPMMACNGLAVFAATLAVRALRGEILRRGRLPSVSERIHKHLLLSILIAYVVTTTFVYLLLSTNSTPEMRDDLTYVNSYMQLLVYAVLYVQIYLLIRRYVVRDLEKVNEGLALVERGELDTRIDVRGTQEMNYLSDRINSTVSAMNGLIEAEARRMDEELALARRIQASALPNRFPAFPSIPEIDLHARMRPAKQVGGDFYDYYPAGDGRVAFLVADVSGKGVPAALFMMKAKTLLKNFSDDNLPVNEILARANNALCEDNRADMFVTVWLGLLDTRSGVLEYASAGHNPPVLCSGGKTEFLPGRPGFVLGGMEDMRYRLQTVTLRPGDRLFLYTDGVTEATNPADELYGNDRLLDSLSKLSAKFPQGLTAAMLEELDRFADTRDQFDDITMLCLDYRGPALRRRYPAKAEAWDDALAFLEEQLEASSLSPKGQIQLKVALEELFVNVASYAYPSGEGDIDLTLSLDERSVLATLQDSGRPFDPFSHADPDVTLPAEERGVGGLGIYMVKKTMDFFSYCYENGRNVTTIEKYI